MAKFPYVNGPLFAEPMPMEHFTNDMREALLAASRLHWTRISPAIFGSMFQLVKSKEARRGDGEHYNPLAMAPELLKAHDALDREVDKAFGASRKHTTERQRQELLFENYATLAS